MGTANYLLARFNHFNFVLCFRSKVYRFHIFDFECISPCFHSDFVPTVILMGEYSPSVREAVIQFPVETYQRLENWWSSYTAQCSAWEGDRESPDNLLR